MSSPSWLRHLRSAPAPGESHRFVVSRSSRDERAVRVRSEPGLETRLFHLLDRAHFPA